MKILKDHSFPDNLAEEERLYHQGYHRIAGVDDCGRGPFAGPVVCAAVMMPRGLKIPRLTDSKKLRKQEHMDFAEKVKEQAICFGISMVDERTIEQINIKQASCLAMKQAILLLEQQPEYVLVDGIEKLDISIPQHAVIKGDYKVHSISAASILAKTFRDAYMADLDNREYGGRYGWATNSGYPTKDHIEACKKYGLTPHHRKTWGTMSLFE